MEVEGLLRAPTPSCLVPFNYKSTVSKVGSCMEVREAPSPSTTVNQGHNEKVDPQSGSLDGD